MSERIEADDTGRDGEIRETLLWFSAAGAVIMGLLWIIDVTGVFGLTWTVLGPTTTLVIAVVAAIGTALLWYGAKSESTGAPV